MVRRSRVCSGVLRISLVVFTVADIHPENILSCGGLWRPVNGVRGAKTPRWERGVNHCHLVQRGERSATIGPNSGPCSAMDFRRAFGKLP